MKAQRKKVLLIAGIAVALIVIAAIVVVLLFDINSYKSRIETAASEATGLDVRINGKIRLSLFPFGVSAHDIHVAGKRGEILSLNKLKLGVEAIPLLKKQIKVTRCELVKPTVTIVKDDKGKYNFEYAEKKSTEAAMGAVSRLKVIRLSQGALVYLDQKTGEKTELRGLHLAINDLSLENAAGDGIKNASFTGNMDCKEVRIKDLKIDNVKSPMQAAKGVIYLKPLTMDIFGAKGEGDATADESGADAVYKINLKASNLDFEKLEESLGTHKVIGGKGEMYASLTMKEKRSRTLMSSVDGTFSLRGDNLVMFMMDLDKVLSSYETSQQFDLVDLGAFFVAGPLGTAALTLSTASLKGYRYWDVYHLAQEGSGAITQFISHWKIKDGVADATDCALATHHHRVALKGKLDLVSERYDNVTVAILDDKGCATFKQSVSGPFDSPRISGVSAFVSLGGQISHLFRKTKRFLQGGKCEVFYSGAVRQP
jgi:AsmA protein